MILAITYYFWSKSEPIKDLAPVFLISMILAGGLDFSLLTLMYRI